MKKSSLNTIVTLAIIVGVILVAFFIISSKTSNTSEELAKCIGEKAQLFTQLGCHACKTQEELFGENYKFLNVVDCFYEGEKCGGIEYTPTWIINGEKIVGVQSIEKLKELTGC